MKKMFQKMIALAMCMMLIMALAACGGSGGDTSTNDNNNTTPAANDGNDDGNDDSKDETPAANGDVTEVVFWHSVSGATEEALQSIIDSYNETRGAEKNVRVNLVYQGYEGTDKVILAYQTNDTNNAPDINVGLTSTLPEVMDMDWTVSAAEYMSRSDSEISADNFYEALQRSCTYDGEMVAVPFANSTMLLYYNIDALNEAGLDGPPQTWDELIEYVDTLTEKDDSGAVTRYGLNMQIKRYQLVNFIVSQSETSFFGDNEGGRAGDMTKLTIGEDGTAAKFFEKLDALLETGGYKYIEDNINEEFAQGLHAMVMMSSSRIATITSLVEDSFEWMTAPIPKVNADDTSGAAVGGSCLVMFNRGDEARLEAAWDVLQYCASAESQAILSKASGYIPVNVAAEDTDEMKAYYEENPQYYTALEQMKNSNPNAQEPLDLVYNEIDSIIIDIMIQYCDGSLTAEEAIDKIVSSCNSALDEYHEANS